VIDQQHHLHPPLPLISLVPAPDNQLFGLVGPQSMQSARLFLQSSELGLPHSPSRAGECAPPPFSGGRVTLIFGRGGEGSSSSDERTYSILWYFIYTCTLWVGLVNNLPKFWQPSIKFIYLNFKYAQDTTKVEGKSAKSINLLL
jgi:hypothetical protein